MKSIKLLGSDTATDNVQHIMPSKVICIGRNYVEHIQELDNEIPDEMVVFLKPNSAIASELSAVHGDEVLHYEAELSFLYQKGKFVAVALGLDLTKRNTQGKLKAKGLPWERAKAFDGSAVFSDFRSIEKLTNEQKSQLTLSLSINNTLKQQGGVPLMMCKPDDILSQLQQFMTLEDGDVVMTGTPKGVGVIRANDVFSGQVYIHPRDTIEDWCHAMWQAQ